MYPVTVDVLSQVFAKYGGMEKVIIFNRGNAIQALVQLRDIATASTCRVQLDGQNIYAGCNSLKVQYSSLPELEVKQNNERMFDFTVPAGHFANGTGSLSRNSYYYGGSLSPIGDTASYLGSFTGSPSPKAFGADYMPTSGGSPVLLVENVDETYTIAEHLAALFAVYGNVVRIKMMKRSESALVQMHDLDQCNIAVEYLNGVMLHGRPISVKLSKGGSIPPPSKIQEEGDDSVKEFSGYPLLYARHKFDKPQRLFLPSTTLHISNMPDGTTEEELLSVLIDNGAEVEYLRFLDDQHHIAIIVCSSTENALLTLITCHGQLCGLIQPRPLRIGFGHAGASDLVGASVGIDSVTGGVMVGGTAYYDENIESTEVVADVAPGFEHLAQITH
jgi:RNA recognition motif-containing protein